MAGPPPLKPAPVRPVPPAMNSPAYQPPEPVKPREPGWRRASRVAIPWLFLVMLGCIILQISLAGAGVLADPQYLDVHSDFVHVFEFLPLLIILAGVLAKDWPATGAGVALFFLIGLQYAFIEATGMVRTGHVLNAMMIFAIAMLMMHERLPWKKVKAAPAPAA